VLASTTGEQSGDSPAGLQTWPCRGRMPLWSGSVHVGIVSWHGTDHTLYQPVNTTLQPTNQRTLRTRQSSTAVVNARITPASNTAHSIYIQASHHPCCWTDDGVQQQRDHHTDADGIHTHAISDKRHWPLAPFYAASQYYVNEAYCLQTTIVVRLSVTIVSPAKRLNRSWRSLGSRLGLDQGTTY